FFSSRRRHTRLQGDWSLDVCSSDLHDQVVYRGDLRTASFSTWWLKQGRLQAAFVLNRPEEERALAPKWIQERRPLDPDLLRDPRSEERRVGKECRSRSEREA